MRSAGQGVAIDQGALWDGEAPRGLRVRPVRPVEDVDVDLKDKGKGEGLHGSTETLLEVLLATLPK